MKLKNKAIIEKLTFVVKTIFHYADFISDLYLIYETYEALKYRGSKRN